MPVTGKFLAEIPKQRQNEFWSRPVKIIWGDPFILL